MNAHLQKLQSQTNLKCVGYVKLIEGGTFLDYRIDKLNTNSANPGFWGRLIESYGDGSDSTTDYIKFDATPYETKVNELLSNSEFTAKALPLP